MLSKTAIKMRIERKSNPIVTETIQLAFKHEAWLKIAAILSGSTIRLPAKNLYEINTVAETGDVIVIPGKVLSTGELTKKIKIVALSISQIAKESLKESKSEFIPLIEEIRKNPKAEGVKILQ